MINIKDLHIRDPYVLFNQGIYYLYGNGRSDDGKLTILCYQSLDMNTMLEPIDVLGQHEFGDYSDFWAPEVIKYLNRYYLVMTLSNPAGHRGSYIFVADSPCGPFHVHGPGLLTPNDMMCLDGHIYIEEGKPYLFFCHEWVECGDGEILVAKLNKKLTKIKESPKLLFKASVAPWSIPFSYQNYVTDGPFVTKNKQTYRMIWSSFSKNGYALGVAYSDSIYGPWQHKEQPLYDNDGGHGMIFPLFDNPKIILHSPNSKEERAILIDIND